MYIAYKLRGTASESFISSIQAPLKPFHFSTWLMHLFIAIAAVYVLFVLCVWPLHSRAFCTQKPSKISKLNTHQRFLFRLLWNRFIPTESPTIIHDIGQLMAGCWEYVRLLLGKTSIQTTVYGMIWKRSVLKNLLVPGHTRQLLVMAIGFSMVFLPLLYQNLILAALLMPKEVSRIESAQRMAAEIRAGYYNLLTYEGSSFTLRMCHVMCALCLE